MQIKFNCKYCGLQWSKEMYNIPPKNTIRCTKCLDRNIEMSRKEDVTIDYYKGSPPFPDPDEEDPYKPYYTGGE